MMALERLPGCPVSDDPNEWTEFLTSVIQDWAMPLPDRQQAFKALKLLQKREAGGILRQPGQPRFKGATMARKPKKQSPKRFYQPCQAATLKNMGISGTTTGQIRIRRNILEER